MYLMYVCVLYVCIYNSSNKQTKFLSSKLSKQQNKEIHTTSKLLIKLTISTKPTIAEKPHHLTLATSLPFLPADSAILVIAKLTGVCTPLGAGVLLLVAG